MTIFNRTLKPKIHFRQLMFATIARNCQIQAFFNSYLDVILSTVILVYIGKSNWYELFNSSRKYYNLLKINWKLWRLLGLNTHFNIICITQCSGFYRTPSEASSSSYSVLLCIRDISLPGSVFLVIVGVPHLGFFSINNMLQNTNLEINTSTKHLI